ncbi:hypothetical protein Poly41_67340 [Novipirellula artificiosorum]|uniref:Uncharacterized protein n=1 Tax=Novipirellula artificiosorum TaxID=2528016 RepID=A0A5C6CYP2_9BACT|nr:hypothetical protein Poly41_67340 [Novipirellula artificiosorum]
MTPVKFGIMVFIMIVEWILKTRAALQETHPFLASGKAFMHQFRRFTFLLSASTSPSKLCQSFRFVMDR